jgi:polygalacturonase
VFNSTNNVTINGINISASSTSPNTDGIDPAGSNYLIENSTISTGDDDIAIKPESVACNNISIQNCKINSGHGISVGGQTNDGMNGMTVNNCTFNGTTNGLRLKAGRGNGGLVQNVTYSNITMTNVQNPIYITSWYNNGGDTSPSDPSTATKQTVTSTTPIWKNITFTNVTATGAKNAGIVYGLPEEFIQTVTFNNVHITATTGMKLYFVTGVLFEGGSKFTISSGAKLLEFDATVTGSP